MQRYGDFGLNTNIWVFSSFVCCDRVGDLRQRSGRGFDFVGKAAMRHPDRAFFVIPSPLFCHPEPPFLSSRAPFFVISSVVERSLHALRLVEMTIRGVEMTIRGAR